MADTRAQPESEGRIESAKSGLDQETIHLPGLPRSPLTAQQQLEAVQRMQSQAEHRVKLGVQLYKAAESHMSGQRDELSQLKKEQGELREKIEADVSEVSESFRAYDQHWVEHTEKSETRLEAVESRIRALSEEQVATAERVEQLIERSESLLDQARKYFAAAAKSSQVANQAVDQAMARANEAVAMASAPPIPAAQSAGPAAAVNEKVIESIVERLVAKQVKEAVTGPAGRLALLHSMSISKAESASVVPAASVPPPHTPHTPHTHPTPTTPPAPAPLVPPVAKTVEKTSGKPESSEVPEVPRVGDVVIPHTTTGRRLPPPVVPVQVMTSSPPSPPPPPSPLVPPVPPSPVLEASEVAILSESVGVPGDGEDPVVDLVLPIEPMCEDEPMLYTQIMARLRREQQGETGKAASELPEGLGEELGDQRQVG